MTGTPGAQRRFNWGIAFIVFYSVCFLAIAAGSYFIGGPITAGFCYLPLVAFFHFLIFEVMRNKRSREH